MPAAGYFINDQEFLLLTLHIRSYKIRSIFISGKVIISHYLSFHYSSIATMSDILKYMKVGKDSEYRIFQDAAHCRANLGQIIDDLAKLLLRHSLIGTTCLKSQQQHAKPVRTSRIHNVSFELFQLDVEIISFGILLRESIARANIACSKNLKNRIKRIKCGETLITR